MPEILGIDHIYISVSDLERSARFYDVVMACLGFRKNRFSINADPHIQYYNRHFGYVLRPARLIASHDPYSPGLHHLCLRTGTAEDVFEIAGLLKDAGIPITAPRGYPEYAPDYVALHLNDPDGLRLEITNYREERQRRHDEWESLDGDRLPSP